MNGFGSMLRDYLEYYKISQTDFAERLGISYKHMNEIINGKTSLSIELILAISLLTDIDANLIYYVENKKKTYDELMKKYQTKGNINKMINSYYLKELVEKKWIKLKDQSSFVQNYMDLLEFMGIRDLDNIDKYLSNRYLFKKTSTDADMKKIFLWIRHCDEMTKGLDICKYDSSKLNKLLDELKKERMEKFDKGNLIKLFHKYGIILYIEDALKGSKVRGCVKVMIDTPVIYMTTYYKEKASFYFTLYHEIMHIKKDFNKLKKNTLVDDNDETEIDELALNEMIDKSIYENILSNYSEREKICKKNSIPLCFLYTRLAKEGKISYKSEEYLNNLERL